MKKIIFCLAVGLMFFSACRTTYRCRSTADMPHNLKPISCKDFNDVPTIYWNMLNDCNEIGVQADYLCDTSRFYVEGWKRTLLIEGWGVQKGDFIILCPDSISAASEDVKKASNNVNLYLNWPFIEGIDKENSVDYYRIVCIEIWWHYEYQHGIYRIRLNGAILLEDTNGKYIIKEVKNEE